MSFLFGNEKKQSSTTTKAVGLDVQTSVYGLAIPLIYGEAKTAGNLIWYKDFVATPHTTKSSHGGKGGSSGGSSSTSYTYNTGVMIGLCQGPITGVNRIWSGKSLTTLSSLGMSIADGEKGQDAWTYLIGKHPDQACGYSRLAYAAAASLYLGDSSSLPNLNFEVKGKLYGTISGQVDANPADVIRDLLTDAYYGPGFPSAHLGDLTAYSNYCLAQGLLISPAWTDQSTVSDLLSQILLLTNSTVVESEGKLKIIPYGDEPLTGNGAVYDPPSAPLFDLTDDDFVVDSPTDDPVVLVRKRAADVYNTIQLEFYNRDDAYNPGTVEAKNPALIDAQGIRFDSTQEAHMFCVQSMAQTSADLLLKRQSVMNSYQFKTTFKWSILDVGDIITITNLRLGLHRQWVRMTKYDEDENGILSWEAEEYLEGTGSASTYANQQTPSGYEANYNADPGDTTGVLIFEPPLRLTGGEYELWGLAHGTTDSLWGGAEVFVSLTGDSYYSAGTITAPGRIGKVVSDTGTTLTVDLSASGGVLQSVSANDAATAQTLCFVGGEYIAYETATLTAANVYALTDLQRGLYGSTQTTHAAGAAFARLDDAVFKYPLSVNYVGKDMYFKLPASNVWKAGEQSLVDVPQWQYRPTGAPLYAIPDDVSTLDVSTQGQIATLFWTALSEEPDRRITYIVRHSNSTSGATWAQAKIIAEGLSGTSVQTAALNGTYLIKAVAADYDVESANATEAVVTGVDIAALNAVATLDEAAVGFAGTNAGTAVSGGKLFLASLDAMSDWPTLAQVDRLMWGVNGVQTSGYYTFGQSLDLGTLYTCRCTASIVGYGDTLGDIMSGWATLSAVSLLAGPDSGKWDATIEIRTTDDDPASSSATWSAWGAFVVGDYKARAFQVRVHLTSKLAQVTPILTGLAVTIDMPDRTACGNDLPCPAGGIVVTFSPAFRATPALGITGQDMATGDYWSISNKSAAGFTIEFFNSSGVSVARTFDWIAKGYGYAA